MVAKMPLLISSRMMSAGLTAEQLGELLDRDGAGQLDRAPLARIERPGPPDRRMRRRDAAACAARDGRGCRSYSWPRAPPSMVMCSRGDAPGRALRAGRAGSGVLSARLRAPFVMALVEAVARPADIGAAAGGRPVASADDRPSGVRTIRSSSRFGRTVRQATQDRVGTRRGATVTAAARAYDATSSVARRRPSWSLAWASPRGGLGRRRSAVSRRSRRFGRGGLGARRASSCRFGLPAPRRPRRLRRPRFGVARLRRRVASRGRRRRSRRRLPR